MLYFPCLQSELGPCVVLANQTLTVLSPFRFLAMAFNSYTNASRKDNLSKPPLSFRAQVAALYDSTNNGSDEGLDGESDDQQDDNTSQAPYGDLKFDMRFETPTNSTDSPRSSSTGSGLRGGLRDQGTGDSWGEFTYRDEGSS